MRVALDLDSTLYPLLTAMRTVPGGERCRMEHLAEYGSLVELCGGQLELTAVLDVAQSYECQMRHGLFPGAGPAVRALTAHGVETHVMTSREPRFERDAHRFLLDQGLAPTTVACVPSSQKLALCQELGIDVIADDHPRTLMACAAAGMRCFTLPYRYNTHVIETLGLAQVTNWHQLGPLVLAAALGQPAASNAA